MENVFKFALIILPKRTMEEKAMVKEIERMAQSCAILSNRFPSQQKETEELFYWLLNNVLKEEI